MTAPISSLLPLGIMVLMLALGLRLDAGARAIFFVMVLASFAQNWGAMAEGIADDGLAVCLFALAAPGLAFVATWLGRTSGAETRTVMIEASMQNVAITIFIASTLLAMPGLAIAGLIYAVEMNLVALFVIGWAQAGGARVWAVAQGRGRKGRVWAAW